MFFARFLRSLPAVAVTAMLIAASAAAPITWGPPTNISGDSDVSTLGTLAAAFNVGPAGVPGATMNGVFFQAFGLTQFSAGGNSGNFAFTTTPMRAPILWNLILAPLHRHLATFPPPTKRCFLQVSARRRAR